MKPSWEVNEMDEMYYQLVINKKRTCDESNKSVKLVPSNWRDAVMALLSERGYDLNGSKKESEEI